ncbi:MAG: carbamoyltransferase HypF [Nitrospiraceae bacterium]|nr:carbamoyltransferase HypF [Nitrospiraceae bacterium]
MTRRLRIIIKGVVQGVGFRPFVYGLAQTRAISGFVSNTSEGVLIEAEGDDPDGFINSIRKNAPELSRIDSMDFEDIPLRRDRTFTIVASEAGASFTHISPDISICKDCLQELLDPKDRRYRYPFINCTNCGPRYTITKRVPYDRQNTTMSGFRMCESCSREYNDPSDRRFHAQPNACPECGPSVRLVSEKYPDAESSADPLNAAVDLLKQGAIIALKGIGGFHLCCDAYNSESVSRLRQLKRRSNKPFALMASGIDEIKKHCIVSDEESAILLGSRRPVVLLRKKSDCALPEAVSPNNGYMGFMLPYTPLHSLLFNDPKTRLEALVMTSANNAEEPIVIDNDDALNNLADVADAFVLHDRDIFMRADDSVLVVRQINDRGIDHRISFVRRARGYTPEAVKLNSSGPDMLGAGADLKNSFALAVADSVIMSQHIGDMDNYETHVFYEETLDNLRSVYNAKPSVIVCDLHPDYRSTAWAEDYAKKAGIKKISVQHHHAHIASVMAEHGLEGPVIGVAFDGAGYGTDGNIWGGEFLVCSAHDFTRYGHLAYLPLPGGDMASKECWRCSLSLVLQAAASRGMNASESNSLIKRAVDLSGIDSVVTTSQLNSVISIAGNAGLSALSSGAGRLFDAVAAFAGTCTKNTFEGEAAISLENVLIDGFDDAYDYKISGAGPFISDFSGIVFSILDDLQRGEHKGIISTKFHNALANAVVEGVKRISRATGIKTVALSGGVFQNSYMTVRSVQMLDQFGFSVHLNNRVPGNDGGIALGQVFATRNLLK